MVTATGRVGTARTNEKVQAIEFVTMRAARKLGIPAARVDIREFDGVPAFITTRYDRIDDGTVRRVHQEDFLQALGVLPSRKYEQDGGPSMTDMVRLIRDVSSPSSVRNDLAVLASLFAFNLLTAGVDAHAKNHSLLLAGDQVRLAPAYDLISAHGIWDQERVAFKASAAVKYGKTRRYRDISGRDLARTSDVVGARRADFAELLRDMATSLPDAFEEAIAELPGVSLSEAVQRMPQRIGDFAASLATRMTRADISDTPTWVANPGYSVSSGATQAWVSGRWRNDSWMIGHYRTRARAR
jgi:serine/threonine-protein kinase HipA